MQSPYVSICGPALSAPGHDVQAGGCTPQSVSTSSFSMSGVNAHAVLVCPPGGGPDGHLPSLLWRRKAFGMPWPVPSGHPLLHGAAALVQGGAEGLARFSMRLDRPCLAFLSDHRVRDAALLPAAAMCEATSAAAAALLCSPRRRAAMLAATIAAPLRLTPLPVTAGHVAEAALFIDLRAGKGDLRSAGVVRMLIPPWRIPWPSLLANWASCMAASLHKHITHVVQLWTAEDERLLCVQMNCISAPASLSCSRPPSADQRSHVRHMHARVLLRAGFSPPRVLTKRLQQPSPMSQPQTRAQWTNSTCIRRPPMRVCSSALCCPRSAGKQALIAAGSPSACRWAAEPLLRCCAPAACHVTLLVIQFMAEDLAFSGLRSARQICLCWVQAYAGSGATDPARHCLAQRRATLADQPDAARGRGVSTDHRLAAAGATGGHVLGVLAKPMVPDGRHGAESSGLRQQHLYELVWQVTGTAALVGSGSGRRVSGFSIREGSSTAGARMLTLLQAAAAHRVSVVNLQTSSQGHAYSMAVGRQHGSPTDGGAVSSLLRTFAQESSAVVGSSQIDASATGGYASNQGVSLMLSSGHLERVSDIYGTRQEVAAQLSAVLLPSRLQSAAGALLACTQQMLANDRRLLCRYTVSIKGSRHCIDL